MPAVKPLRTLKNKVSSIGAALVQLSPLAVLAAAVAAPAQTLTLYDGTDAVNLTPFEQGQLILGALGSSPHPFDTPTFLVRGGETSIAGGVRIDSDGSVVSGPAEYAGYSNINPLSLGFIGNSQPLINSKQFSLSFTVGPIIYDVAPTSQDRAAFNVLVVGDGNQAIELGWGSDGKIFSQSAGSPGFERQEVSASSDYLSGPRHYELRVTDTKYALVEAGITGSILEGQLRHYSFDPTESVPPLIFNPYEVPGLLFFGDNTGQAAGSFDFYAAAIEPYPSALPAVPAPPALLAVITAWGATRRLRRRQRASTK